ncbi:neurogenic locus notch 1 -like protein [Brachionus plicatilis]|uniref:Neurogenic locus notch 1-like protein n=1 Tax=Brachionus plicatilis TaxID=10195 RepID=A0A3M7T826_BRAPC|nr:neurogenic locus notch 1 -like protein [Brachionus plicatilis]
MRCNITVKENENDEIEELESFELDLDDLDVILGLLKQKGDINNCLKNCSNNGKCKSDSNNTIKCFCNEHFAGVDCSFDTRPCSSKQCLNNGKCVEVDATSFECNCSGNYVGNRCQFLRNDICANKTCSSHGYCYFSEEDTKVKCKCFKYYTGENCEIEANEIKQIKETIKITTIIALVVIFLTVAFFIILDMCGKFEKKKVESSKKIHKKMYKLVYVNKS